MYKEEGRHLYDVHAYNNSQTKLTISLGSFMAKAELLGKPSIIAYVYSRAIDSTGLHSQYNNMLGNIPMLPHNLSASHEITRTCGFEIGAS